MYLKTRSSRGTLTLTQKLFKRQMKGGKMCDTCAYSGTYLDKLFKRQSSSEDRPICRKSSYLRAYGADALKEAGDTYRPSPESRCAAGRTAIRIASP